MDDESNNTEGMAELALLVDNMRGLAELYDQGVAVWVRGDEEVRTSRMNTK